MKQMVPRAGQHVHAHFAVIAALVPAHHPVRVGKGKRRSNEIDAMKRKVFIALERIPFKGLTDRMRKVYTFVNTLIVITHGDGNGLTLSIAAKCREKYPCEQ